jgi:hypothetical protein
MSCKLCGKKATGPGWTTNRIRYCKCSCCNECHVGGILNYGIFGYHWYSSISEKGKPKPFLPLQSHGGHGWIPDRK